MHDAATWRRVASVAVLGVMLCLLAASLGFLQPVPVRETPLITQPVPDSGELTTEGSSTQTARQGDKRSNSTRARIALPLVPAVLGIAARDSRAAELRVSVEKCELALAVIGNRFNDPRDVLKLKAMAISSTMFAEKYLFAETGTISQELRQWLEKEHRFTVFEYQPDGDSLFNASHKGVDAAHWDKEPWPTLLKKVRGYCLRMELPRLLLAHVPRFRRPGASACDRHVLYTDTDVVFRLPRVAPTDGRPASALDRLLPAGPSPPFLLSDLVDQYVPFSAATTEWTAGWINGVVSRKGRSRVDANTGVLVLNVPAMAAAARSFADHLLSLARAGDDDVLRGTFDQAAFNGFFNGATHGIITKDANWRLISGLNPTARVHHFQGIKCESLLCDPPSGIAVAGSDGLLRLPLVDVSLPCNKTGTSWRKHDTLFMSRAPGGFLATACAYEVACRRALVDARAPFEPCMFVARKPKPAATGFGFALHAYDGADCHEPNTCSYFVGASATDCRSATFKSRVPPVLRVETTAAMVSACRVTIVTVIDLRHHGDGQSAADAAARAKNFLRSAQTAKAYRVVVVLIREVGATVDDAVERAVAKAAAQVGAAWTDADPSHGRRVDVESTTVEDWLAFVPPASHDLVRDHRTFAVLVPLLIATLLQRRGAIDEAAWPCPAPLILLVPPGATIESAPTLTAGAIFPSFVALAPRCPHTAPWPLGVSKAQQQIDAALSHELVLLNALTMAGAVTAAVGFVDRLVAVHGRGALDTVDVTAAFISTAAVVLPAKWIGCASRVENETAVVRLPPSSSYCRDISTSTARKHSAARNRQPGAALAASMRTRGRCSRRHSR
jgi:hypothetical protein